MTNQPQRGKRPWPADVLRSYIAVRIVQERVSHLGPATSAQVQQLVILFEPLYTSRRDCLGSLSWLLRREIGSRKDLNKSEASVLIAWLRSDPPVSTVEAERVLIACLKAQGQLALDFPDTLDEPDDVRHERLRAIFSEPAEKLKGLGE